MHRRYHKNERQIVDRGRFFKSVEGNEPRAAKAESALDGSPGVFGGKGTLCQPISHLRAKRLGVLFVVSSNVGSRKIVPILMAVELPHPFLIQGSVYRGGIEQEVHVAVREGPLDVDNGKGSLNAVKRAPGVEITLCRKSRFLGEVGLISEIRRACLERRGIILVCQRIGIFLADYLTVELVKKPLEIGCKPRCHLFILGYTRKHIYKLSSSALFHNITSLFSVIESLCAVGVARIRRILCSARRHKQHKRRQCKRDELFDMFFHNSIPLRHRLEHLKTYLVSALLASEIMLEFAVHIGCHTVNLVSRASCDVRREYAVR